MRTSHKGKAFEEEWARGKLEARKVLGQSKLFVHRFNDLQDYIGKKCPRCRTSLDVCGKCGEPLPQASYQPPKQPCDFFSIYNGMPLLEELKSLHSLEGYDTRYIKPHQIRALLTVHTSGGEGFFIFNSRRRGNMRTFAVDVVDLLNYFSSPGFRYIIPWEDMERIAVCTPHRRVIKGIGASYDYVDYLKQISDHHNRRISKPVERLSDWGDLQAVGNRDNTVRPYGRGVYIKVSKNASDWRREKGKV